MSSGARSSGVPSVRIELADGRRIQGFVDEGYGSVVDTFRANFLERRDLGAACSVYVAGRLVVDLWGGLADRSTLACHRLRAHTIELPKTTRPLSSSTNKFPVGDELDRSMSANSSKSQRMNGTCWPGVSTPWMALSL